MDVVGGTGGWEEAEKGSFVFCLRGSREGVGRESPPPTLPSSLILPAAKPLEALNGFWGIGWSTILESEF